MAQNVCRLIKSVYEAEALSNVAGADLIAISDYFQIKTKDVKLSVDGSIFAPFDYDDSTKIDTNYTYKFDTKCTLVMFDAVAV